jgi:hypothetical protein
MLSQGRYFDPSQRPGIEAAAGDGQLRVGGGNTLFTTAYFHQPPEIARELAVAGFTQVGQYGLEGAAWLMGDLGAWLDDPAQCELLLRALQLASRTHRCWESAPTCSPRGASPRIDKEPNHHGFPASHQRTVQSTC